MPLHDDTAAFGDFSMAEYLASAPKQANIEIDRILVERFGLRKFIELAWPTVEGNKPYHTNWHIDAICEHLEAVSAGELRRLIIAIPPRHMKSVSVAVMWPAWDWVSSPERQFLFSSYAQQLSTRDSAKCRRVVASPWYQACWGDRFRITTDQNTKQRFENTRTGYRLSTSVGGALTGEGGAFVVVDDALNAKEADSPTKREGMLTWWSESMSSRLNDPATGAFVVIQQRLHSRDLIGDIIAKHGLVQDGGEYTFLCLPAEYEPDHPHRWFRDPRTEAGQLLWPNHVPRGVLETLKKSMGPYSSAGQLQQRPAPREGGTFKLAWFRKVQSLPLDLQYARAWDLAASERKIVSSDPDFTATALMGFSPSMRRWYIVDIQRWREDPAEIERLIKQVNVEDEAAGRMVKLLLPQDPGQAGKAQGQAMLAMLAGADVKLEPQTGDKMTRALPFAGQASGGNVSILEAEWNDDFLAEITGFPTNAHDDQVDAVASAFTRLTGGAIGLLEYYMRQQEEDEKRTAEARARLAANGGTLPGLVVIEQETTDLAVALTGSRPGPPRF